MESIIQSQPGSENSLQEMNLHQLLHLALMLNLNIENSSNDASWLKALCRTEINRTMKDDQKFIDVLLKSLKAKNPENVIDQRYLEITGMPFINGSSERKDDTQTCCISSLINALLNIPAIKEIVLNHQEYGNCPILSCLANYLLQPKHNQRTVRDLLKTLKEITTANMAKNVEIKAQNRETKQKNLEITDVSKKVQILPLLPDRYMFEAGRQEDPTEILTTILEHCQPLRQALHFKQRSMYTCSNCKCISWSPIEGDESKCQIMMLEMNDNINDLEELLKKSQSLEKIKKNCDDCLKKDEDHDKMVVSYEGPKVLAISLKRWKINHEKPIKDTHGAITGYDFDKITAPMNLPSDIKFAGKNYMLRSAVTHYSEIAQQGHYMAHIFEKLDENGQRLWTITNDSNILHSKKEDPDQAYMFFYIQQQPLEKSTEYARQFDDLENRANTSSSSKSDYMEVGSSKSIPATSMTKKTLTTISKPSTKSTKSTKGKEEAIPIDSEPNELTTLKARIVIMNDGKLRIQCLECMKTFGKKIIKHAEQSACKTAFNSKNTCEQLNMLFAQLQRLQRQQAQKKSYEKRKKLLKDEPGESSSILQDKNFIKSKESLPLNKQKIAKNSIPTDNSNNVYWSKDDKKIMQNFRQSQSTGLSYPCISCHRLLFKTGVTPYNIEDSEDKVVLGIKNHQMEYCVTTEDQFKCENKLWLCHNCKKNLTDGKMPNICHANGLAISKLPESLRDLTQLELMLIKKKLVFIKVRELNTSRMLAMNNRVTNVPISDTDLFKTCSLLPRKHDELGTVNVAFKRIRKSPYYYRKPELIRPKKVNDALEYLQEFHPSYAEKVMEIKKLNDKNTYNFANLPLIGQLLEDEKNLPTLEDCFDYLSKNDLLLEWLNPLLEKTEDNYGILLAKLLRQQSPQPQGKDSFLNGLIDQMRYFD